MFALNSLPTSVRERLERAELLASRDIEGDVSQIYIEVGKELAKTCPELCGLLLAGHMGHHEITIEEAEWETTLTESPRRNIFGKIVGVDHHKKQVLKRYRKTLRLS